MGLKFRRGTNAQKSGSLAFGEPYVNTDLGTLQIGGLTGDITLGASGTGSQGTFSGISGSSLDITGYAKIDGNLTLGGTITIGDASTDNVVVNADLSSSIIPNNDNSFDLGSTSFRYRAIHGTNIYGTINATNGVISGSSQLPTLATTGSNTFRGNQTIIGSGAGFAAYISTSVNDATLGLDTTANVNALYFLKNGEKNFELSYDTTNANGIFRLLPYDNNSFFEIGNPSNSGADYVFISEPTYGNVLIGPGIGNGVSSLTGSIPLTDKVQIAGNLYVNGAIRANSFTGSVAATNGVVSGSSQVIGILSSLNSFSASNGNTSLNSYTGSNDTTNTAQNTRLSRIEESTSSLNAFSASENTKSSTLALYTASVDAKFTTLQTLTASMAAQVSRLQESTASLNLYTSSNDTTNTTQNTRLTRIEESTSSLNTLTASLATTYEGRASASKTIFSGSSQIDVTTTTNWATGIKTQLNTNTVVSGSSQVNYTQLSGISANIISASTDTANVDMIIAGGSISANLFGGVVSGSAQVVGMLASLNTYTGSNDTTNTAQNSRLTRLEESTASLNSLTSSYARTNSTNVFTGNQTITGSLFITQDLIVQGSSSIQTISSSRLDIGDNIIQLNVNSPSLRFGGLAINDSGSAGGSGSFLYDSVEDEFIFVHRGNGTNVTSSHFVLGPETIDNLGNETYLTNNRLPKGTGKEHLVDSNITDTGTLITLGSNTVVNGTIVASGTALVSGSAQINYTQLSGISANIISASTDSSNVDFIISGGNITANLFGGVVSGSSQIAAGSTTNFATDVKTQLNSNTVVSGSAQVVGILSSLNTYTGSNDTTNTTQNNRLSRLEESTSSLNTLTASLSTTYEGRASASKTLFSGSSQVVGSAITTNTVTVGSTAIALGGTATTIAGLTSVSSTGFTGALTGNASTATTLATARTINGTSFNGSADITIANLVSGSSQITAGSTTNFATDVKTQLNSNTVVSGSSQIAIASVSGYDANRWVDHTAVSISAGNGLSGGGTIAATRTLSLDTTSATFTTGVTTQNNALGVVSGSRTISGITLGSNLATLTIGTGLSGTSYNGSTGVTIANTGVTSNVAGTGISLSGGTGAVTITNSGVTSLTAGTGVSVSGATGGVTVSIGQAVATSSNVQFNSLGIGMAASATAGRIDATNDIVAFSSSDIRFKENIKPIENALQKISKISGNTYDWKAENKIEHGYEGNDVGVIAQEIEEVLPQLVQTRDNGYKAVKYDKLVALLIEGIKEQQTQIHSLTLEIEKLKESKGL